MVTASPNQNSNTVNCSWSCKVLLSYKYFSLFKPNCSLFHRFGAAVKAFWHYESAMIWPPNQATVGHNLGPLVDLLFLRRELLFFSLFSCSSLQRLQFFCSVVFFWTGFFVCSFAWFFILFVFVFFTSCVYCKCSCPSQQQILKQFSWLFCKCSLCFKSSVGLACEGRCVTRNWCVWCL